MNKKVDKTWLLIDTSGPTAVVAIVADGEVLASKLLTEKKKHAENLPGAIKSLMDETRPLAFDFRPPVAIGTGPGSFIGIRIGIAYAKGLAMGWDVPLIGVPSQGVSDEEKGRNIKEFWATLQDKIVSGCVDEKMTLKAAYGAEPNVTIKK